MYDDDDDDCGDYECDCGECAVCYAESDDADFADFEFANPGGNSALRAASATNPRNLPCPTCGRKDMLTPKDVRLGYQCDRCADALEGGGY
jgi:hypothetical protein